MVTVIKIQNKHGLTHAMKDRIEYQIMQLLIGYEVAMGEDNKPRVEIIPNLGFDTIEDMDEYEKQ